MAGKWLMLGIAIVAASLLTAVLLYVRGAERAKAQVERLEADLAVAEAGIRQNGKALEQCVAINRANATEAALQRERAIAAERRVAALKALSDRGIEEIDHEARVHRSAGLDCPAIDADFRLWLRSDP